MRSPPRRAAAGRLSAASNVARTERWTRTKSGATQVWPAFTAGNIAQIRGYCEADVANTYLVYLRFQLMRGALTQETYGQEIALVRSTLERYTEPHWREFLSLWPA